MRDLTGRVAVRTNIEHQQRLSRHSKVQQIGVFLFICLGYAQFVERCVQLIPSTSKINEQRCS